MNNKILATMDRQMYYDNFILPCISSEMLRRLKYEYEPDRVGTDGGCTFYYVSENENDWVTTNLEKIMNHVRIELNEIEKFIPEFNKWKTTEIFTSEELAFFKEVHSANIKNGNDDIYVFSFAGFQCCYGNTFAEFVKFLYKIKSEFNRHKEILGGIGYFYKKEIFETLCRYRKIAHKKRKIIEGNTYEQWFIENNKCDYDNISKFKNWPDDKTIPEDWVVFDDLVIPGDVLHSAASFNEKTYQDNFITTDEGFDRNWDFINHKYIDKQ